MADKKYKYKQFSIILDPLDKEDNEIIEYLQTVKTRKNKYTDIIRRALKEYIKNHK